MKKLKIYEAVGQLSDGKRGTTVAEISIGENGAIKVDSEYPEAKRDLQDALEKMAKRRGTFVRKGERTERGHRLFAVIRKPTDPDFLEVLAEDNDFWWGRKFGGYKINNLVSEITED